MHEYAIFMADVAAASQGGKTIKDGRQGITLQLSAVDCRGVDKN